MEKRGRNALQSGFTLIEVLVAFVILALFLGTMLPTLSSSLTGTRAGSDTMTATAYAQSLIAGVGVDGHISEGTFTDTLELTRFTSRLTVRPYPLATGDDATARLYEVTAQVQWLDGVRTRAVSLATLRYAKGS